MGVTRGKNAGVGGTLVSVLLDGRGTAAPFNAKITEQNGGIGFPKIDRRGRGSAGAPKIRLGDSSGSGKIAGEYQLTGYPLPDKPKFTTGALVLAMQRDAAGKLLDGVSLPVRFTSISWSLTEGQKESELWAFSAGWELAGTPTWTWNGVQVTVVAPAANDQETYEGLAKTYDANGLLTDAVQRIDCEGIADTDAAEATKLAAAYAAAITPPQANLKVVSIAMARTDSNGISIWIRWGLQDSKDNVETPQNVYTQDPNALQDLRTLAQVFDTGSPPSTPAAPSGLKIATYTDTKLNDQKSARTWTYRRTDTADDVINPETRDNTDPNDIQSSATRGDLYTPGSPPADPATPSGLKLRSTNDTAINDANTNRVYEYGKTDTIDDIVNPLTSTLTDPSNLTSQAAVAAVDSVPSLPSGFVSRGARSQKINDDHTLHVVEGGLRSTAADIVNPQTRDDTDPNDIRSAATRAALYTPGSPPADPATPSGLKLRSTNDTAINDANTSRVYEYGKTDSIDDLVNPLTSTVTDPSGLASRATVAAVDSSPSLPAGFVSRGARSHKLNDDHTLNVVEGGLRSTEDDLQMPGTWTLVDPDGVESHGQKTAVYPTASPPSDPAPPSGLQIVGSKILQENNLQSSKVWYFGTTGSIQKIQIQNTHSTRSASQPWTDAVGQEFASSNSDATDADTLWAAAQSVAYIYGLRVFSIDPARKMVVYDYLNPGIQFQGLTGGDDRLVECQLSGSNVQVYVAKNYAMAGGYRHIFLSRQRIVHKPVRRFIVSRMLKGTTLPEQSPSTIGTGAVTMPNIGDMNSGSFQGIATNTCLYKGPAFTVNLTLSGTRTFFMGWQFFSDKNGLFTGVPTWLFNPAGLVLSTTSTVGSSSPGWENIANLGLTGAITQPSASSFSAFTAAGDVCS
jgi:hypothetical protein